MTTEQSDEDVVILTYNGTPQITPSAALPVGYVVTIKDGAGTGFCQFVGTVDGVANPIYNTAYFVKNLLWNGTQWNSI